MPGTRTPRTTLVPLRAGLVGAALALAAAAPAAADVLALLPVKFLDTSGEAVDQSAEHQARLEDFGATLAAELTGAETGTAIAGIDAAAVAAACTPETPECLVELARKHGAQRALFVVVIKTSTLIMQGFATLVDTQAETVTAQRDISFRGDSDDSWHRAASFLARDLH